jgi:DNA polymerase-4
MWASITGLAHGRPLLGGERPGPATLGPGAEAYGERWERVIIFLDMNAFFVNVEARAKPWLRGKPVLVVGSRKQRSVVAACSYETRAFGVKSGMPSEEARRLCRDAIIVPADIPKYTHAIREVVARAHGYTPVVEIASIDELALDVTTTFRRRGTPRDCAAAFAREVREDLGLPCSLGVAPNKMMAKVAAGLEKPNGLTVVRPSQLEPFLEELPTTELPGIGEKMGEHLRRLGARTCGQLGRLPLSRLKARFGIVGEVLRNMGRGIDRRPLTTHYDYEEAKSVGNTITLNRDTYDAGELRRTFLWLCERVARRLRGEGYCGRCVYAIARYPDFYTVGKSHRLPRYVDEGMDLFRAAWPLLPGDMAERGVRMLGVSVSMLLYHCKPGNLFELRRDRLTATLDVLNKRYGREALKRATLLPGLPGGLYETVKAGWHPG